MGRVIFFFSQTSCFSFQWTLYVSHLELNELRCTVPSIQNQVLWKLYIIHVNKMDTGHLHTCLQLSFFLPWVLPKSLKLYDTNSLVIKCSVMISVIFSGKAVFLLWFSLQAANVPGLSGCWEQTLSFSLQPSWTKDRTEHFLSLSSAKHYFVIAIPAVTLLFWLPPFLHLISSSPFLTAFSPFLSPILF